MPPPQDGFVRWFVSIALALSLLIQACFLGRLPLGIETSFADGSAKSWRFLRGPDVSGTLEGAGGARGVLAVLKDDSSWKAVAADTLGNVLALAGVNGDFTRRTFDPWGNPLVRDASGSLRASTLTERRADYDALPLAWASQEVDPDTGLTHYHFREYSPSLGGWLTTDPIGLAGGYLNLRSYLGNRPADALDVWGEIGNYLTLDGTNGVTNSGDLSPLAKAVMDVWKDPRVAGTLQAVGGVGIICLAVGGSVGSGGTSLALLWVGADQTFTRLKQAYTEAPQQSYTDQAVTGGAKALGASDETAAYAGRTVETITVVWAGGVAISSSYTNASRMGNASTPKAVSTRAAAAETASSENAVVVNSTREVVSEIKVVEETIKKCPCPAGRQTTTVLSDVTVVSRGKVVGRGDVYLRPTIEGIESGSIAPRNVFRNDQKLLPSKPAGYCHEYVHETPGVSGVGSQRVIRGAGGELYYTPDHYGSFIPLN